MACDGLCLVRNDCVERPARTVRFRRGGDGVSRDRSSAGRQSRQADSARERRTCDSRARLRRRIRRLFERGRRAGTDRGAAEAEPLAALRAGLADIAKPAYCRKPRMAPLELVARRSRSRAGRRRTGTAGIPLPVISFISRHPLKRSLARRESVIVQERLKQLQLQKEESSEQVLYHCYADNHCVISCVRL